MLYIRHGEKSYKNGQSNTFPFDPNLTDLGKENAYTFFNHILTKYNIPDKIISSPYLRARETAKIAHDVIFEKLGINIPIFYDKNIGEYLGNQKNVNLKEGLHPETLKHNPISNETIQQYRYRIQKHISHAENAWYITHGMVIKSIAFCNGHNIDYPGPLGAIYINNGTVTII